MLMITVALAGTAYMYISGIYTARTATAIDLIDSYCFNNTVTITMRNIGTIPTTTTSIEEGVVKVSPSGVNTTIEWEGGITMIEPGKIGKMRDTTAMCDTPGCIPEPGTAVYRISPPGVTSLVASVYCAG
jgi:hypothetical protein